MNIKKYKIIYISFLSLLFISCGGGGSTSSSNSSPSSVKIQNNNMSEYEWSLYANINEHYKKTNNINPNAHINLGTTWNITKGKNITVAVIDEDFDVNHPDLKNRIIATYNAMDGTSHVSFSPYSSFSHGTATAGMIASSSLGIAPESNLILINIDLGEEQNGVTIPGTATTSDINKAFDFAKNNGANIISCSWSGTYVDESTKEKIQELKDAGIIIVFASGNESKDLDSKYINSESELDSVIGVGATTSLNDVANYSNYGSQIDILAPGGGGENSDGTQLIGVLALDKQGEAGRNYSFNTSLSNNYSYVAGTSFATPKVAGAIALLKASNPNLNFEQIRNILISTAQKIGKDSGAIYDNKGFNTKRAYGKIDVNAAIQKALVTK